MAIFKNYKGTPEQLKNTGLQEGSMYITSDGSLSFDYIDNNQKLNRSQLLPSTMVATKEYVDTELANLVDSAPETLDTLEELASAIEQHEDVYEAYIEIVNNKLDTKVDVIEGKGLSTNDFDDNYRDKLDSLSELSEYVYIDESEDVNILGDIYIHAQSPEYSIHQESVDDYIERMHIYVSNPLPIIRHGFEITANLASMPLCLELDEENKLINHSEINYGECWGYVEDFNKGHIILESDAADINLLSDIKVTYDPINIFSDLKNLEAKVDENTIDIIGGKGENSIQQIESFANGSNSSAMGLKTIANGEASFAEGQYTRVDSLASHAEGYLTIAGAKLSDVSYTIVDLSIDPLGTEDGKTTLWILGGDFSVGEYIAVVVNNLHFLTQVVAIDDTDESVQHVTCLRNNMFLEITTETDIADQLLTEIVNSTKVYKLIPDEESHSQHAEGMYNIVVGNTAHAEGHSNAVFGEYAHIEGVKNVITEGGNTAHVEGKYNFASGRIAHAEGIYVKATGGNSHAEGSKTTASGNNSHAQNSSTQALHTSSHAGGLCTRTSRDNQTVIGEYNADNENALFIIGNGTATKESKRSNAFVVLKDGTIVSTYIDALIARITALEETIGTLETLIDKINDGGLE